MSFARIVRSSVLVVVVAVSTQSAFSAGRYPASAETSSTLGLGFSTISLTGAAVPLSAKLNMTSNLSLELLLEVAQTSAPVQLGGGGIVRYTAAGNQNNGFHVGFGALAGAQATGVTNAFALNLAPLVGTHFMWPNAPVGLSLDGGVNFQLLGGAFDFATGGFSGLLGLSAHYYF